MSYEIKYKVAHSKARASAHDIFCLSRSLPMSLDALTPAQTLVPCLTTNTQTASSTVRHDFG